MGRRVCAHEDIPSGRFVASYIGEYISPEEADQRTAPGGVYEEHGVQKQYQWELSKLPAVPAGARVTEGKICHILHCVAQ